MKKILYMHSGSGNHGCEAIIRTTAKLLGGPEDLWLWSLAKHEDETYGADSGFQRIVVSEELRRGSMPWLQAQIRRRILGQKDANLRVFLGETFRDSVAICVGGDNYCYPWSAKQAVELNRQIRALGAKTVLWACSVEESAITEEIRKDLAGYDLITAREEISYQLLKKINPNTVKVADPAFLLEKKELPLPESFVPGNTVGINLSPLIMKYGEDSRILKNYENLMRHILQNTDMHICLIPHVVWENNDDRQPLNRLYERFRHTGRVCMVEDANACCLKGYIARCRLFVGARTHATIAAYSSVVPTLVTGYSVKARGIARDLFGTEENYVLPVQDLQTDDDLTEAFCWLCRQEDAIRYHLRQVMPDYQKTAVIHNASYF